MNTILLTALLIAQDVIAPGGLQPLRPPAGTTLSRSLRIAPNDLAPSLRELADTDLVSYLRTEGPWYEVDVRSKEGLEFRGWLKGVLPTERTPPVISPAAPIQKVEQPNPLNVEGVTWFWQPEAKEHGAFRLTTGFQKISYTLNGNVNGTKQAVPPGYDFMGWSLGVAAEFIPLQTRLFNRVFFPVIRGNYSYGLHRVSFSNPFPNVPEVAGKAYQISTNSYSLEGVARLRVFEFKGGYFQFGLGLGFLYYEVQPDLDPIQGGNFNGQVIFLDTAFSSLTVPFEIYVRAFDDFYLEPRITLCALPNLSENASGTPGMKTEGMPLQIELNVGYFLSSRWALELESEFLSLKGQSSGTATRLGTTYSDGEMDLSYQRYIVGLRYHF